MASRPKWTFAEPLNVQLPPIEYVRMTPSFMISGMLMPAPGIAVLIISCSNDSDRGLSVAAMVASSSSAAETELGEEVRTKSWRTKSFT